MLHLLRSPPGGIFEQFYIYCKLEVHRSSLSESVAIFSPILPPSFHFYRTQVDHLIVSFLPFRLINSVGCITDAFILCILERSNPIQRRCTQKPIGAIARGYVLKSKTEDSLLHHNIHNYKQYKHRRGRRDRRDIKDTERHKRHEGPKRQKRIN